MSEEEDHLTIMLGGTEYAPQEDFLALKLEIMNFE